VWMSRRPCVVFVAFLACLRSNAAPEEANGWTSMSGGLSSSPTHPTITAVPGSLSPHPPYNNPDIHGASSDASPVALRNGSSLIASRYYPCAPVSVGAVYDAFVAAACPTVRRFTRRLFALLKVAVLSILFVSPHILEANIGLPQAELSLSQANSFALGLSYPVLDSAPAVRPTAHQGGRSSGGGRR